MVVVDASGPHLNHSCPRDHSCCLGAAAALYWANLVILRWVLRGPSPDLSQIAQHLALACPLSGANRAARFLVAGPCFLPSPCHLYLASPALVVLVAHGRQLLSAMACQVSLSRLRSVPVEGSLVPSNSGRMTGSRVVP